MDKPLLFPTEKIPPKTNNKYKSKGNKTYTLFILIVVVVVATTLIIFVRTPNSSKSNGSKNT